MEDEGTDNILPPTSNKEEPKEDTSEQPPDTETGEQDVESEDPQGDDSGPDFDDNVDHGTCYMMPDFIIGSVNDWVEALNSGKFDNDPDQDWVTKHKVVGWAMRYVDELGLKQAFDKVVSTKKKAFDLIRDTWSKQPIGKYRMIYDLKNQGGLEFELPGDPKTARAEGDPPHPDGDVNKCYENFGIVYDFYEKVFNRKSLDGNGFPLIASVNYSKNYPNAVWHSYALQMVFGDGGSFYMTFGDGLDKDGSEDSKIPFENQSYFADYVGCLDVIAHELTHGVIAHTVKFHRYGEPGALSEHVADVFGAMALQWHLNQTYKEATWLIGEGLIRPHFRTDTIKGLRSLKEPGKAYNGPVIGIDPQVEHYKDFKKLPDEEDAGGVHTFSGIPNKAFYLVCEQLEGYSWEVAGQIWYKTITNKATWAGSNFSMFAKQTWLQAKIVEKDQKIAELAKGKAIADIVFQSWQQVGVVFSKT